ncbi:MAG: hypothetical protein MMC33_009947 [Icmadophila ericetorum]|nr:hypothetical protein [Icmadophila ericetorum]
MALSTARISKPVYEECCRYLVCDVEPELSRGDIRMFKILLYDEFRDGIAASNMLGNADPDIFIKGASKLSTEDDHEKIIDLISINKLRFPGWFEQFYQKMRDNWNYIDPASADADEVRERWLNLNAFTARLTLHLPDDEIIRFGMYTLSDALAQKKWLRRDRFFRTWYDEDPDAANGHIPAAAQWILLAGEYLYMSKFTTTPGMPTCKDYWVTWRQMFHRVEITIDEESGVEEQTRKWAIMAGEGMDAVVQKFMGPKVRWVRCEGRYHGYH